MAGLAVEQVLAIGASQSAGRMRVDYDAVLPQVEPVFDGYAFIVGSAPRGVGAEPVFQVLSETDVRTPLGRRADSDVFRRWEVAGSAHSGWDGQVYRRPISSATRAAPAYNCARPRSAGSTSARWSVALRPPRRVGGRRHAPPHAPYLEFDADW